MAAFDGTGIIVFSCAGVVKVFIIIVRIEIAMWPIIMCYM